MGTGASAQLGGGASVKKEKPITQSYITIAHLQPGDLVKFKQEGGFHWAVYLGEMRVIHVEKDIEDGDVATGDTPSAAPAATPGANPAATPGATPAATPGANPASTPGAASAATPGTATTTTADDIANAKVKICEELYWTLAKEGIAIKANTKDGEWEPLQPDEVIKRAKGCLGESKCEEKNKNSQHFAKWCRYDKFDFVQDKKEQGGGVNKKKAFKTGVRVVGAAALVTKKVFLG